MQNRKSSQDARVLAAQLSPIALLLMTSTAWAGDPTDPTCWLTDSNPQPPGAPSFRRWADTTQQINVYVDTSTAPDMFGRFHNVQAAFYNPYYVAKATEIAVERLNEQAGIPQRLVFAGFKTNSPDIPPAAGSVVIEGSSGCLHDPQERPVEASGGCERGANGFCTTGTVKLFKSYAPFCDNFRIADGYSDANDQGDFVNLLVHELGHTLGRSDAYDTACGIERQTSVMEWTTRRELTDFDRSEMQAVYGSRAATNVLRRRILMSTSSAWGVATNVSIPFVDIAPGPASSFAFTSIPVTTVRFINGATAIALRLFAPAQGLGGETLLTGQFPVRKPVSTSLSPTGAGVMAYITETGGNNSERRLCIRRRTNGVWSAEGCGNPCTLPSNSVATAYDPVSTRFFVAHSCETSEGTNTRVVALATSVDCTSLRCAQVSALLEVSAAETPVIACEPWGQTGSNCRLVYAQRNVVGQRIAWRSFGFVSDPYGFNNTISFGNEIQTQIESEHAPAVTYYGDAFQMALTRNGTLLQTYYMFPSSSDWTYDGTLNTTGWISPPFYSPTQQCVRSGRGWSCDQLHLFWVQYRT